MKSRIACFTIVLAFLPGLVFGQTQSVSMTREQVASGIPPSDGELTPAVQSYITRASVAWGDKAVALYREAAKTARRQGHLPSLSMWRVANQHFADGDAVRAGRVLDDLADEAAERGDLGVQALAIHYSAWLYGKAGRGPEFEKRMTKLLNLLDSPYLPVAVRDAINESLNASNQIAGSR